MSTAQSLSDFIINPDLRNTFILLALFISCCKPVAHKQDISDNEKEFDHFISNLERVFIYNTDKQDIIDCIKIKYRENVDTIKRSYDKVLYYESLLNEFHDSHISLNTNTDQSYRLRSPIYAIVKDNRFYIKNVFSSELETKLTENLIGAEILRFNEVVFDDMIAKFSSKCLNKDNLIVVEWLANKIVAGKRNEPRMLTIKLKTGDILTLDMDTIRLKENVANLKVDIIENIAYVRINNSLGNSDLVNEFDMAIDELQNTHALILDLRNTPNGGNTDVAEPIMGRFITETKGYQICENKEKRYTKEIRPRKKLYAKPLYVLVGRWTGSMGEGIAIGFDGMKRATIIGTEMSRLAGGIHTISLLNSDFGYQIPVEKMYHLNGQLRETFVPQEYVNQLNLDKDYFIEHALQIIKSK